MRLATNWVAVTMAMLVCGCTAQVNSNALDMQSSYKSLLMKQVVYNLIHALNDDEFFPSQAVVSTGSAQTTNTITPSLSVPLPTATVTNAVQTAAAATVTNTKATALTNATLGVTLADSWQFSWSLDMVTDPNALWRLRMLYLYGVGKADPEDFQKYYPTQGDKNDAQNPSTQMPTCVVCRTDDGQFQISPLLRLGFVRGAPDFRHSKPLSYGNTTVYVSDYFEFNNFVLLVLSAVSKPSSAKQQSH
jgi:hypothetical protein